MLLMLTLGRFLLSGGDFLVVAVDITTNTKTIVVATAVVTLVAVVAVRIAPRLARRCDEILGQTDEGVGLGEPSSLPVPRPQ